FALHEHDVIICPSHEDPQNEANHIPALLNTQVDGNFMSVTKTAPDTSHIEMLIEHVTPRNLFARKEANLGVSPGAIADFADGYMATEHLIKQGAGRLAHFSGDLNLEIYRNRHDGYLKALEDNNILVDRDLIVLTNSGIEAGAEAVAKLWAKKE